MSQQTPTLPLEWREKDEKERPRWRVECTDARAGLRHLPAAGADAIVTDPPYGIGFMDREWDRFDEGGATPDNRRLQQWTTEWAQAAALRVKPAALWLVFGSPRTVHRTACGLEDAGLRIIDCILWLYGEGFPKSHELRPGVGTSLKPAYEPILVAQVPPRGSRTGAHARYGTGGFNINDCLIEGAAGDGHWSGDDASDAKSRPGYEGGFTGGGRQRDGRWPPNIALDAWTAARLDEAAGRRNSGRAPARRNSPKHSARVYRGAFAAQEKCPPGRGQNAGGASRFFYCPKANEKDRNLGLIANDDPNTHPCVKPTALMRWLVRLATPARGHVIDPFAGSGSTGVACLLEHRSFTGFDQDAEEVRTARRRLTGVEQQPEAWTTD